ncbi:uncharacterized protein RAG0_13031 [Rhynchosporium agropyri]|uniref:Uncharacterized protein n=1 Tax=Rhynchosporium agropyri TaxID=914238 RepID=A0A1E1LAX6_9HELO|nr:uncharacterized protein RAG0_13031 [Rhynchosporium agropyri]
MPRAVFLVVVANGATKFAPTSRLSHQFGTRTSSSARAGEIYLREYLTCENIAAADNLVLTSQAKA